MTASPTPKHSGSLLPTLAILAAIGASTWIVHARTAAAEAHAAAALEETRQVRQLVELIRLEDKSEGRGIGAIIEQIEHWAPLMASSGTAHPTYLSIGKSLEAAVDAIGALGRDAFGRLRNELEQTSTLDDETRRWLLRAALRADRDAGLAFAAQITRGTHAAPTTNVRLTAAHELIAADKKLAGEVLRQIVDIESARGVTRQPSGPFAKDYERAIPTNAGSQFFNFIHLFASTGHAETELVLRQLLGRSEHDLLTYLECVRELGRLKSTAAAPRIRELFETPPGRTFNPMFQNTCAQAIADIEGAAACEWFKERLQSESTPLVAARLQDLIKQLCSQ